MLKETLGEKLQKTRLAKKLTIRDVTRETNIVQKFIEALETNNFNKFPSETYLLGFLRSYANFLQLDEDELLMLYKSQRISESQTPLEELTKPTSSLNLKNLMDKKKFILLGKILLIPLAVYLLVKMGFHMWNSMDMTFLSSATILQKKHDIPKFSFEQKLNIIRDKGETLLKINEGVIFQVDNINFAFQLQHLEDEKATLVTFPGEKKVFLPLQKQIESSIPDCPRQLLFELKALTQNTAKIELQLGKQLLPDNLQKINASKIIVETTQPEKLVLKLHLELIDNSYVEAYLDGKKEFAGLLKKSQEMDWTAKQTIQLHLGNADGVRIRLNGKDYSFKGKVKNKIFSWKRDPLNPSKYEVIVNDNH